MQIVTMAARLHIGMMNADVSFKANRFGRNSIEGQDLRPHGEVEHLFCFQLDSTCVLFFLSHKCSRSW